MYVIHALPSLLGEAERLQMTKINAKDKANQTPLSVLLISCPLATSNPCLTLTAVLQTSCRYYRVNGYDHRAFETSTGIAQDQAEHG